MNPIQMYLKYQQELLGQLIHENTGLKYIRTRNIKTVLFIRQQNCGTHYLDKPRTVLLWVN